MNFKPPLLLPPVITPLAKSSLPPRIAVAMLGALSVAACSGSGASTPSILAQGASIQSVSTQGGAGATNAGSAAVQSRSRSSTLTVSGVVEDLSNPNQPLIQAGPGCGYLFIYLTSSTKVITDGTPIAVGRYAESVGTGSCATYATATTLYVAASATGLVTLVAANGASPAPSSSPAPASSPSPVPSPTASGPAPTPTPAVGLTSAACLSTVSGQQWPTNCLTYASNAPWNIALPDSPAQKSAFTATGLISNGSPNFTRWYVTNSSNNTDYPFFFAKSSDPFYTLNCTNSCASGLPGSIQMPSNAQVAGGSDHHIGIVQPGTGAEIDCWLGSISGSTLTCDTIGMTNLITGSGVENPSSTSGNALGAGVILSDELQTALNQNDGYIHHAIATVITCVSSASPVLPMGTTQAATCSNGTSVPVGTQIQYTQTFAQIDALSGSSSYQKVMLRTMHRYGLVINDTNGITGNTPGGGFWPVWEDPTAYIVNGKTVPWSTIGPSLGFGYDSGNQAYDGTDPGTADSSFASHLVIVNPCYAQGTCTQ